MCVFVSLKGQCRCDNMKRMSVCLKACFCLHMQPGGEMVASVFCPFLLITCNKHLYKCTMVACDIRANNRSAQCENFRAL